MSDYLTDEEQVARLKSWWDENGKSLVISLVVVVVGVAGYRWYEGYREERNIAASELYEAFLGAESDDRSTAIEALTEQAGGTSYAALALLRAAKNRVAEGDYAQAEAHLRDAVEAAPEAVLADVARLRLARVLQQLDRIDDALGVLGQIRSAGFRSPVAELQGDIHLQRGERALAHEAYSAALEEAGDLIARPVLEMKVSDTARVAAEAPASAEPDASEEQAEDVDADA